ncbi:MAG: response regulator [Lachnospiraceae bacterium]|nr:response regulator [Lachnospiraceae bacterium]
MMSDDLDLGLDLDLDDLDLDLDFDLDDLGLGEDLQNKVMIIDDDAGTLRSIKSLLDGAYAVSVANSGKKALDMLPVEKPDVILLDYEMPMMNGPETLQKIRMKPGFKDTPVIFLTGVNDRSQIAAALALRPAGYLLKPVNQSKLLMTILDALNGTN